MILLAIVAIGAFLAHAYDVSPSGKTDGTDSAAIQAAIDAAGQEGGSGKVTLADGFYHIATVIRLTNAVELVGNDADRSKVIFDAANVNGVHLLYVENSRAFAHGIRFQNSYSSSSYSNYIIGPLYITGGTVSNCTVKMSKASKFCGGVGMSAGTIADCDITGCASTDGLGAGAGGGLRLCGATCVADRLVITNNTGNSGTGGGVYMSVKGARLLNSLVANNSANATHSCGGVYCEKAGTIVSNCVIRGNSCGSSGGGIYGTGDVYDSLIGGNTAGGSGGGFYMTGGTMRGCTVAGNTATVSGAGVYQSNGDIQDSILWYNGSSVYLTKEDSLALKGGTCTYTCAAQAGSGAGNITDKTPAFVDPANGDYRLSAVSPCRGKAKDGISDMGYYKFSAAATPRVAFTYTIADGKAPASTTFTAQVEGATVTGYVWDFGDKSGTAVTMDATTNHTFAAAGRYTVKLTVKTSGADLVYVATNAVNLGSDTVYVRKTGSNEFPYATTDSAATDIHTAIDCVICSDAKPGKVMIGDGTWTITKVIALDKAVELVGNDADRSMVVFDANNKDGVHLLYVRHAKAFAHGFWLQNSYSTSTSHGYDYYCGPVMITAGMVSNCTVKMSTASKFCGGVGMGGGTIVDCDITGCASTDGGGARIGGALRLYGAAVADRLVITNNSTKAGAGVYLHDSGAKLLNSLIANNSAGTETGGGVFCDKSGAIVSNCVIRNNSSGGAGGIYGNCNVYDSTIISNTASSSAGGGIYQTGGTVARCVIADCKAETFGGGVYKTAGTLDHVTVARCNAKSSGSGIYQSAGTVKNSISYENGDQTGYSASDAISTAGTITYSCARELTNETNIAKSPLFRNVDALDLRLFSSSPCREAAEDETDMGAIPWVYDPDEPVTIIITVATDGSCYPVTATYGCEITGVLPSSVTNYVWTFGDGTTASVETNGIVHVYSDPGVYSVTLTLQLANGTSREAAKQDAVAVYSDIAWVDVNNPNPEAPYDTEAKAANSIKEALDAVYVPDGGFGTVKVKAGHFTSGIDYTFKRAIHLVSASGQRDVLISNGATAIGVRFKLQNEGALVSGFVISNATVYGTTWGVFPVESGTVTNCAVILAAGYSCYSGGGMANGSKAKIVDCYFERCSSSDSNGGGYHGMGGLLVKDGGTVENCVVTNCWGTSNVGGIQLSGSGTVRNTTIVGCSGRGGVLQQSGLFENCRILKNTASSTDWGSGVYMTGGKMRNCLVAENTSSKVSAGIRASGSAVIENCTVAGNVGKTYAGLISETGAKWYNTLSWGNTNAAGEANPDSVAAGTFDHCLVGIDPHFRRVKGEPYHVTTSSPARDGGVVRDWMEGATDLKRNPRILNHGPDIGCYEDASRGLIILVK